MEQSEIVKKLPQDLALTGALFFRNLQHKAIWECHNRNKCHMLVTDSLIYLISIFYKYYKAFQSITRDSEINPPRESKC